MENDSAPDSATEVVSAKDAQAERGAAGQGEKKLRVTLIKGLMGKKQAHRASARGLGLKWRNHSVDVIDTPQTRGMINQISYMVKVAAAPSATNG